MIETKISSLLIEGAAELGVGLSTEQVRDFSLYLQELRIWGKRMNLIRRASDREIILKDFLDSLTVLKRIPQDASVVDLGSGAGFPGIPLKIARPDLTITLLEATRKKFFFLKNLLRVLDLGKIEVYWVEERAIRETQNFLGKFDFVVSRAFGSLPKFTSAGISLLKRGGILLAMKGKRGREELEENLARLEKRGLRLAFTDELRLPFLNHERTLIGLEKD